LPAKHTFKNAPLHAFLRLGAFGDMLKSRAQRLLRMLTARGVALRTPMRIQVSGGAAIGDLRAGGKAD
jgi:hypothetical protein